MRQPVMPEAGCRPGLEVDRWPLYVLARSHYTFIAELALYEVLATLRCL
jgi:hypothetical protein